MTWLIAWYGCVLFGMGREAKRTGVLTAYDLLLILLYAPGCVFVGLLDGFCKGMLWLGEWVLWKKD